MVWESQLCLIKESNSGFMMGNDFPFVCRYFQLCDCVIFIHRMQSRHFNEWFHNIEIEQGDLRDFNSEFILLSQTTFIQQEYPDYIDFVIINCCFIIKRGLDVCLGMGTVKFALTSPTTIIIILKDFRKCCK